METTIMGYIGFRVILGLFINDTYVGSIAIPGVPMN